MLQLPACLLHVVYASLQLKSCFSLKSVEYFFAFRILRMMLAVSAHTDDNRMTASAVAACMAPLLLRPLLAGECGLEDESEVNPDNAAQLLAATAAANNAQSIVTTLLEEYDHIFEVSRQMLPS